MSEAGREFKRSNRFGLIGVGVVAVLTAAIAVLFGSTGARPTGALIAIFVVVFGFVAVLLVLQRRDLNRARARATAAAEATPEAVTDPTMAPPPALLAALAVRPVDREAVAQAGGRTWDLALGSLRSEGIMLALIACAVVPWQLWQETWSMIVFGPAIVIYAGYLAARALIPGGALDRAYDDAAATLAPLGLALAERPATYTGQRHGRAVAIRIDGGATTTVSGAVRAFEVRARSERLRADPGAPPAVIALLESLRASSYWRGVSAGGGRDGVVVERPSGGAERWMCDLWLAERLAEAAGGRSRLD